MFGLGFATNTVNEAAVAAAAVDAPRKKRSRRRRKPKSRTKVEPVPADKKQQQQQQSSPSSQPHKQHQNQNQAKKQHDAPMTKRDLYFSLRCEMVGIGGWRGRSSHNNGSPNSVESSAVGRVTVVNWENQVVLDTFVKIPVPVTDFRTKATGISPSDVCSPTAMSFAQVRAEVERILRGKILIGHGLSSSLNALGLTHPWSDVRDTSTYSRFLREEIDPATGLSLVRSRPLADLALDILSRKIPPATSSDRSMQLCVSALDLYKSFRRQWEEELVRAAQQKDARLESHQRERAQQQRRRQQQQQEQLQMQYQQPSSGVGRPHAQGQPPMHRHPNQHQSQLQQQQPQRPRVHSYEVLPPEILQQYAAYGGVPPTATPPAQMGVPPHNLPAAAATQPAWFCLGRKPVPQNGMAPPSAALSSHAMQALSAHAAVGDYESPTRFEGSNYGESYYDTSSQYDGSTDYDSSVYYDESVASESVASESVISTQQEEIESRTVHLGSDGNASHENSSWFRFGSRRTSRYSPQQQRMTQALTSLAESDEPQDEAHPTEAVHDVSREMMGVPYYEPPRYYASLDQEKSTSSNSKWFGFRRSKSPSSVKAGRDSTAKGVEGPTSPTTGLKDEQPHMEHLMKPIDDTASSQGPGSVAGATQESEGDCQSPEEGGHPSDKTKWFGFRRSKSPKLSPDEQADDELLEEVLGSPAAGAHGYADGSVSSDPSSERLHLVQTSSDSPNSFFSYDARKAEEPSETERTSQSSKWFGFRRGKSTKVGYPDEQDLVLTDNPVPTDSTDDTDEDWLKEVIQQPVDETVPGDGTPSEKVESTVTSDAVQLASKPVDTKASSQERPEGLESQSQPSSWSIFRRAKSSKSKLSDDDATISDNKTASPEDSTEATDEDWLREVMNQSVATETDRSSQNDEVKSLYSLIEGCRAQEAENKASRNSGQQSANNWFKLFRPSSKSTTRPKVSRLASAAAGTLTEEDKQRLDGVCVEQAIVPTSSVNERNVDDWLTEVVSPSPVDASPINPSWLGFREVESPPDTQPMTFTEQSHGDGNFGEDINNYFLRSRLCTESTMATVASGSSTPEEECEAMEASYEGIEQSLKYLNI